MFSYTRFKPGYMQNYEFLRVQHSQGNRFDFFLQYRCKTLGNY